MLLSVNDQDHLHPATVRTVARFGWWVKMIHLSCGILTHFIFCSLYYINYDQEGCNINNASVTTLGHVLVVPWGVCG